MEDLIALLPPEWVALWLTWAPAVLAVVLAVTGAAHALLPIARRFEAWTATTASKVDDGIMRRIVIALQWVSRAGSWLITHVPRLAVGDPRPPADPTEPKADDPWAKLPDTRRRKPPSKPPIGGALALAVAIAAGSLTGCSPSALGLQADLVAGGGIVWAEADATLVRIRARHLDSIVEAAREECGDGECTPERQEHWRAELAAAEQRWAPALECRATVPAALHSWIDGIETAHVAQTEKVGLQLMGRLGARFAIDYATFVQCVNAHAPVDDPHLPELPPEIAALADLLTPMVRTAGGEAPR